MGVAGGFNQFFIGTAAGESVIKSLAGKMHLGYASNAPAITINTSNFVGLGTTNPVWSLDVSGTAIRSFASGAVEPGFIADYASSNGYGGLFIHTNGVRKWRIGNVGDTDASNPALFIWQEGVGARMYFRNNGYVGVGTTVPNTKLSVSVPSDSALGSTSDGLSITDGTRNVQLLRNGTGYNYAGVVGSGSMLYSYDRMYIVADTANPILFHTNGAERVRIGPNGNVGIGVTNPTNTLQVNGQIAIKGDESADNVKIHIQASDNSNRYTIKTDLDGTTTNDLLIFRSNTVDNMLVLKGNGNVGIGTTNLVQKFQVDGTVGNPALGGTTQTGIARISNATDNACLDVGIRAAGSGAWLQSTDETDLSVYYPLLLNPNGGNVGVGTTAPLTVLDVRYKNTSNAASQVAGMTLRTNQNGGLEWHLNQTSLGYGGWVAGARVNSYGGNWGQGYLEFITAGAGGNISSTMTLNSGQVGIGITNPTTLLSVGGPGSASAASGITFGADTSANLYRSAASTIKTDGSLIVAGNVTATNLVSGNGTANFITKWNGTKSIANSQIFDDGTYVGINTAVNTTYRLQVVGSFAATTKSFDIVHPTISGKRLTYASLEGPENGVYYRGQNNNNEIILPHYWSGLVHDDSITVNLTAVGRRKDGKIRGYSVDQIGHNKVYIYTDSNDNIYNYYYTIFAERKDVSKLVIERDME